MPFLKNWFLPHEGNNHKAHLIKSYSLFLLCFVFTFLQISLNLFLLSKPAVLGFSANITPERVIDLTNKEREKQGLGSLKENKLLSEAARQKAADMFAFNYWAHISPSGRTPWTFFTDVGYRYQYAGENLARDFRDPESVVQAWMASPSHRENMANPKYQEVGVAVVDGSLQGVETTLVVQLFGTAYGVAVAESPPQVAEKPAMLPRPAETLAETPKAGESALPQTEKQEKAFPLASPLDLTRAMVVFVVGILIGAFAMDILTVSHRETPRLSSRSLAQMMFLIFVLVAGLLIRGGAIL
jgi:hypothetical protein